MQIDLTAELIVSLSGIVVSLFFAYFPGVKNWFDALDPVYKPLWNLGVLLLVSIGAYLYGCRLDAACLSSHLEATVLAFIGALVSNQATFQIAVKQVKRRAALNAWND